MDAYGLDPLYFVTTPSLALAAALRLTNIELEQISDANLYLFFERYEKVEQMGRRMVKIGKNWANATVFYFYHRYKRGGVCCINSRHARVNHELCPGYNGDEPVQVGIYVDANNLYGRAMQAPLPYKNIRFCKPEEERAVAEEFLTHQGCHLDDNGDVGFVLEVLFEEKNKSEKDKPSHKRSELKKIKLLFVICQVTLRYPEETKSYFSEYPPLPFKRVVERSEYGPFTKELMGNHGFQPPKTAKLITDLHDKCNYPIHYSALKQVLALGVELVKVHRVVR